MDLPQPGSCVLRRGRVSQHGHIYHVTTATCGRQPFFAAVAVGRCVVRALRAAESELTTRTLAFVVMPDHLHWLFILQHGSLPTVVGQMKGRAARYASSALSVAGCADPITSSALSVAGCADPITSSALSVAGCADPITSSVPGVAGCACPITSSARGVAGHAGPIWQPGYYDHALRTEESLVAAARYIIGNPLRAGLVTRIGDYPLWDCIWM